MGSVDLRPLDASPFEILSQNWGPRPWNPVCSVLVPTYRHEPYLADALNGILAQRTTFPFEVIVRDDASDDGTAAIARRFEEGYPDVVTALIMQEQTYPRESMLRGMQLRARGEFVAICEGDDYWTDPLKLEKQVARLQADRSVAAVFHDSVTVEHQDLPFVELPLQHELPVSVRRDLSGDEVATTTLPFRSLLYRNADTMHLPQEFDGLIWTEDTFLSARIGIHSDSGAVFIEGISPSVYRRHPGNLSRLVREQPLARAGKKMQNFLLIAEYLAKAGRDDLADVFVRRAVGQLLAAVEGRDGALQQDLLVRAAGLVPTVQRFSSILRSLRPISSLQGRLRRLFPSPRS